MKELGEPVPEKQDPTVTRIGSTYAPTAPLVSTISLHMYSTCSVCVGVACYKAVCNNWLCEIIVCNVLQNFILMRFRFRVCLRTQYSVKYYTMYMYSMYGTYCNVHMYLYKFL